VVGLRSNFLAAIVVVSVLVAIGVVVTLVMTRRSPARVRSVARGLTVVSVVAVVAATVAPRSWPPERDGWGDLVLRPGGDSLGRLDVLLHDPASLAAWLIVLNVALFVPLACFGFLGWGSQGTVLLVAIAVSVGIEILQLAAFARIASTDDVILNLVGAVVGIGLGRLIAPAVSARSR
jgi:hypothetical protein